MGDGPAFRALNTDKACLPIVGACILVVVVAVVMLLGIGACAVR